jgi:thiol-disulfide isomerase/thioredoxin
MMTTALFLLLLLLQSPPPPGAEERTALQDALADAGSSQVDFVRALERHLEKYPKSEQRAELERALLKASMELKDARRTVLYGERALATDPANLEILERVARYLLTGEDREHAKRALDYARRIEATLRPLENPSPGRAEARYQEEKRIVLGKSLVYQARATGNLGNAAEAEKFARRSYEEFPSAESAREIARWLDRQGKTADAIQALADAFAIADPNATAEERHRDRERLGEWHRKLKGSETGLGDLMLAAFDRTRAQVSQFTTTLRKLDPNANAKQPLEYTIAGLNGESLALSTLKGKVVVFDFWATWCGPCRAQQPLYEEVKARFRGNDSVVFLNVSTDENREAVKPFLDRNGWKKTVYFEDGLSAFLRVTSIPTTMIVDKRGEIASRMNGYVPERFVEVLTARIREALEEK